MNAGLDWPRSEDLGLGGCELDPALLHLRWVRVGLREAHEELGVPSLGLRQGPVEALQLGVLQVLAEQRQALVGARLDERTDQEQVGQACPFVLVAHLLAQGARVGSP